MSIVSPEGQFLFRVVKPYRTALVAAFFLLTFDSLITLSLPWFAGRVVGSILERSVPDLLLLSWLAILAVQGIVNFNNSVLLASTSSRVIADVGSLVYDHLQSLPLDWHQQRRRGEILSLATSDVWRLSAFLTGTLVPLLPLAFTCLGASLLLIGIEPWIGLAIAVAVPIFMIGLRLFARHIRPLSDACSRADAVKYGMAEQNLSTLPLIKAFTRENYESERYSEQGHAVRDLEIRQARVSSVLTPVVRWVSVAAVIGLLWLAARGVQAGAMEASELVSLLLYGLLLTQPVSQLAGVYAQVQVARGSALRLRQLLDERPEPDDGNLELDSVRGEIRFERVAFAYAGREPLFDELNLRIEPGETVAIVGFNGTGKSTLAHLLMRFISPTHGSVSIDGIDLRRVSLRSLRAQIGIVSQHVLLLNASIARNIGYGRGSAASAQIESAAHAANAHEFISGLPLGYDTVIGDDGSLLSGGQKQRIALARALLKDPPILILDEATSMFDPNGEAEFISACRDLLRRKTVLLITHRPACLALADRVLRLEGGHLHEVSAPKPMPSQQIA